MLLVIDVGNTHTVIGVFDQERLIRDWRIHTEPGATVDEFHFLLAFMFKEAGIEPQKIRKTVVSCVVPPLVNMLAAYCKRYLDHLPLWITPETVKIPIRYDNPGEVGADRLVNAVGAFTRYPTSLIVIDFGTATTFDVISDKGEYIGGAISPGIGISAEALYSHASKLPRVEFEAPERVIGRTTSESMKSGLIFGYAELVDGMVRRIQQEMLPKNPKVIATGGMAGVIQPHSKTIEAVESGLTLEGLRIVSEQAET